MIIMNINKPIVRIVFQQGFYYIIMLCSDKLKGKRNAVVT